MTRFVLSVEPAEPPEPEPDPAPGELDPRWYHRLTTCWQGDRMSLDVLNDGGQDQPILAPSGHFSGQHWRLWPLGSGLYRLTTQWRGPDLALDGSDRVILAPTADDQLGQMWRIARVDATWHRLTAMLRGDGWSLDIVHDGVRNDQPHLAPTADVSGQLWKLSPTRQRVEARKAR